jgi:hypothetical protein
MAIKRKQGKHEYWIDGEGLMVPAKHISQEDKDRDKVVEDVCHEARKIQMIVKNAKQLMLQAIDGYLAQIAASYGEEWQGNATLTNFSQTLQVEVKNAKILAFDEKLKIAKSKIDKCIEKWAVGSKTEIIALVNQAFKVNQKGQMDVPALLKLPQLEINDSTWQEAMAIIKDSVTVQFTKKYVNIREKAEDGSWRTLTLNFSSL